MKSPPTPSQPPVQPGEQVTVFGSLAIVVSVGQELNAEGCPYWWVHLRDAIGEFGCDADAIDSERIA